MSEAKKFHILVDKLGAILGFLAPTVSQVKAANRLVARIKHGKYALVAVTNK